MIMSFVCDVQNALRSVEMQPLRDEQRYPGRGLQQDAERSYVKNMHAMVPLKSILF